MKSFRRLLLFVVCLSASVLVQLASIPRVAFAQTSPPVVPELDETPGLTPRSAVREFLQAARHGRWWAARRYIGNPDHPVPDRERLARQLRVVLERRVLIDTASISDRATGRLEDGLAPNAEEIARFRGRDGTEVVRLTRLQSGLWVFSRDTVQNIGSWYADLPDRWLHDRLPERLLRAGPFDVAWWQWIALVPFVLVCWVVARLLGFVLHVLLRAIVKRTPTPIDDQLIDKLGPARTLVLGCACALTLEPYLLLPRAAEVRFAGVLTATLALALVWALMRVIDLLREVLLASTYVSTKPSVGALVPLTAKLAKVLVSVLAAITLLQWMGVPIASLVAGLGVGGVVVALAAKPTLENLFAGLMLGLDQPFRPGDSIKVDDLVGTVEAVGLRSTQIRTLDRTVVTVPNAKLAELKIESYSARDRMRINLSLMVAHARSAQVREAIDAVKTLLANDPKVIADTVSVWLKSITTDAMELEIGAAFTTTSSDELSAIRQTALLAIMEAIESKGLRMAAARRDVRVTEGSAVRAVNTGVAAA